MKFYSVICGGLLAGMAWTAVGDEAPEAVVTPPAETAAPAEAPPDGGRGGRRGGPGGPGGGMDRMLQERFPEEYAEYTRLNASDPEAARQYLQEKMRAAGFEPGARGGRRDNEAAATPAAATETVRPDRNFRRVQMRETERRIAEAFPDEYRQLEAMRIDDPEGAREFFTELAERLPEPVPEARRRRPGNEPAPAVPESAEQAERQSGLGESGLKESLGDSVPLEAVENRRQGGRPPVEWQPSWELE